MRSAGSSAPDKAPGVSASRSIWSALRRAVVGRPKDLRDGALFHQLSLIPVLAWIGLGADGLSSSSYGPQEAFLALGSHAYLAVPLALLTAGTVFIISSAYSRIIEEFPQGGGGYVVATSLLGKEAGIVSGCALLVDYVLTITVSVAAAGDALFSFMPLEWHGSKVAVEAGLILALVILNMRGVRESVVFLAPIFALFVATHVIVIVWGLLVHAADMGGVAGTIASDFKAGLGTLGMGGMLMLLLHAYSLGGGTYTGIEAVSNGLPLLREPRVVTGRRTMIYMAVSLAITAGGLLLCYVLFGVRHVPGQTSNAVLLDNLFGRGSAARTFSIVTLISEGAILVVAAQTGFLGGPRVVANMALDGWAPRHLASLSERLTTENGIMLMGTTALAALLYTGGNISHLVVMYSINVFLTFALSMLGMSRLILRRRRELARWKRRLTLFAGGFVLCSTILIVTTIEKFGAGGWLTLAVTSLVVLQCYLVRAHYSGVRTKLLRLYSELEQSVGGPTEGPAAAPPALDPKAPTAAVLVASYGGLGIHTVLRGLALFPGHFRNLVFISVGTIDSGDLKEDHAVRAVEERTKQNAARYLDLAASLGLAATCRTEIGTDPVAVAEKLCLGVLEEFPKTTFFAGKLVFERPRWFHRLLHNETAFAIERRLHRIGNAVVMIPARI